MGLVEVHRTSTLWLDLWGLHPTSRARCTRTILVHLGTRKLDFLVPSSLKYTVRKGQYTKIKDHSVQL